MAFRWIALAAFVAGGMVVLLPCVGFAQEPRTQVALGLAPLDQGVGLWLIRPKTMVGLELGALELERGDLRYHAAWDVEEKYKTIHFRVALVVKRILAKRTVSPFGYLAAWVDDREETRERSNTTWGRVFFEAGWGGLWRPVEKVSVSLSQGVALRGGKTTHIELPNWSVSEGNFDTETTAIYMLKTRLLVLIHF